MKKKTILAFLLVFSILCGCSGKQGKSEAGRLTSTAAVNDFIITLTAERTEYTEKEAEGEAPFSYKLEMEYVGEEEGVTLGHGNPLGGFSVSKSDKVFLMGEIEDMLKCSYMEKCKKITVNEWTGEIFPEEEKLEPGVYTIDGFVSFQAAKGVLEFPDFQKLQAGQLERIECTLSLPLVIQ